MHAAEPSARPLQRLFVDFVGPLTCSKHSNIAILVVADSFSKFVSFYPTRSITASVVVDCLERQYFPAFGAPKSVVTDNARIFQSLEVKNLCFRWGVKHIFKTPYYPQAPLAERVNRNLKAGLKIYHHELQGIWDEYLPLLAFAFNNALHESTKVRPDVLFLGREIESPLDSQWDAPSLEVEAKSRDRAVTVDMRTS